jgi:hypothetical protein
LLCRFVSIKAKRGAYVPRGMAERVAEMESKRPRGPLPKLDGKGGGL